MAHKSLNITCKRLELHLRVQQKNLASESMNDYRRPPLTRSHSTGVISSVAENYNNGCEDDMLGDAIRRDVSV